MDTLFGLPAHPLIVHGATVLVPLAAIGGIVIAFSPTWRERIGIVVAGIAGIAVVLTWFASESGEALEEGVEATADWQLLRTHTQMGDGAAAWILPLAALVIGLVAYAWSRKRAGRPLARPSFQQPVALLLALGIVASGVAATYRIIAVGHSGAKSVWHDVKVGEGGEGGEYGEHEGGDRDGDGD